MLVYIETSLLLQCCTCTFPCPFLCLCPINLSSLLICPLFHDGPEALHFMLRCLFYSRTACVQALYMAQAAWATMLLACVPPPLPCKTH